MPTDGPSRGWARLGLGAILAAPVWFIFRSVLSGDDALFARDVFHQYWPLRVHAQAAWAEGHLPLWDDASQAGLPLLANIHAAVLYPFNAVYAVLPFSRGYGLLVALHLVVAAGGTFGWARALGVSRMGAVVGALVFTCSAPVLGLSAFGPHLMGIAWVPWAAHALVRPGSAVGRAAQVAVVVALQCLCGDPMTVVFSGLVALSIVASEAGPRAERAVLAGAGAVVGVGLAAVQLWPAYGLLGQTTRGASGGSLEWSMRPIRFFELVLPRLFGGFESDPPFWGTFLAVGDIKTPFSLSVYVGAGVLVVGLVGVGAGAATEASARRTRGLALGLLAVGVVLALGDQFVAGPLLAHVPPFSLFRYPEKYLVVALFGVALLVGLGVDRLGAQWLGRRGLGAGVAAAVVAVAVGVGLVTRPQAFEAPFAAQWPGLPLEVPVASFSNALFAFAALVVAVLVAARLPSGRARQLGVAALLIGDSVWSNRTLVWLTPSEMYFERPPIVDVLNRATPHHPFRIWRDNARMAATPFLTETPEQRMVQRAWELVTLKSTLGTVFGVQELSDYSPVVLRRWQRLLDTPLPPGVLTRLFNTCFIIEPVPDGAPVFAPLPNGAGVRRTDCAARLFSVRRVTTVATEDEAFARVGGGSFSVTDEAVFESEGDGVGGVKNHAEAVVSRLTARDGWLAADVTAGREGGFVVFGTAWAKGWRATIDGERRPVRITDGAVMGLEVPPGQHSVTFEFVEPWLGAGASLSGLVSALVLTAWLGRRRVHALLERALKRLRSPIDENCRSSAANER